MMRFIVIGICLYLIYRLFRKIIYPFIQVYQELQKAKKKGASSSDGSAEAPQKTHTNNIGEYIDYEEVK